MNHNILRLGPYFKRLTMAYSDTFGDARKI